VRIDKFIREYPLESKSGGRFKRDLMQARDMLDREIILYKKVRSIIDAFSSKIVDLKPTEKDAALMNASFDSELSQHGEFLSRHQELRDIVKKNKDLLVSKIIIVNRPVLKMQ
jgi:hypothetical protein